MSLSETSSKTAQPPFTVDDVERASRYHRPLYVALAADLALDLGALGALAFAWPGDRLFDSLEGLPWWLRGLIFPALVLFLVALVRLPLAFWRGYLHERRWGFSTQGVGGWLADRAKALAVGVVLGGGGVLGLVASARLFPSAWPLVAAPAAALLVLLLGFLAPVVFEPLFNRFVPLESELADELRALSRRAAVPVRDVLVADASRRTRKSNAYVSGLGRSRRVVLFDTLLEASRPSELRLVVAHELGHRRARHVAKGTLLGMIGAAVAVLVLWALLRRDSVLDAVGSFGPGDPRIAPFVLLAGTALELAALPFGAALSRRWEREADRFSLELTDDLEAFESVHRGLARSNLSDLRPPRAVYVILFTHPTPPDRIAAARRWSADGTVSRG